MARKKFKDTSANRKKRWSKKSPMARYGKSNGSWKGGKSPHYYRRKANAGKNEVVHHKSGGKVYNSSDKRFSAPTGDLVGVEPVSQV